MYPELADLCVQYGLEEKMFNSCLRTQFPGFSNTKEKLSKEQRLSHVKQIELKSTDNLPDIVLEGKSLGHPDYYLVKLPKNDPRAYLLGKITQNEQFMGGRREKDVISGVTLENNGFYVLLKQKKLDDASVESKISSSPFIESTQGKKINYAAFDIAGHGYAWRSEDNNLVFTSWENKTPAQEDAVIIPFLRKFSEIVTHEKNGPLRVLIGYNEFTKTPKIFTKDKYHPAWESMLTGEPSFPPCTKTMIYCNEERRKPLIRELASILDSWYADKNEEAFPKAKKLMLYKWICNRYSESYFKTIKEFLLSCDVDFANALHKMVINDNHPTYNFTREDPLTSITSIKTGIAAFKKAKLSLSPDLDHTFVQNINWQDSHLDEASAVTLNSAFKKLEEVKLDKDPEIRAWVLGFYRRSEADVDRMITSYQELQNAGLEKHPVARKLFFENFDHLCFKVSNLISDYTTLKQEGLDMDETLRYVMSHHYEYRHDKTLASRILVTAKKLKERGMYDEIDVRNKAFSYTDVNKEDSIMNAFALLREAKLEKETDFRQAALRSFLDIEAETETLRSKEAEKDKRFHDHDGLSESTSLKETLAAGGNIEVLKDKYRHEFRDHNVNDFYHRFKKILTAPENRMALTFLKNP